MNVIRNHTLLEVAVGKPTITKEAKYTILAMMGFLIGIMAVDAMAITAPTSGFAMDVYNVFIIDILKGPAGFTFATACVISGTGIATVAGFPVWGATIVACGIFIFKADSIVTSLGAIVN